MCESLDLEPQQAESSVQKFQPQANALKGIVQVQSESNPYPPESNQLESFLSS